VTPGLQAFLSQNGGMITTTQANKVGISNECLRRLVKAGELEKVGFGVYVAPSDFADKMYAYQQRRPKIIYSHETALFLHGLSDRDPIQYTVTVPSGYNTSALRKEGFLTFSVKRDLYGLGVIQMQTMFSHGVSSYSLERTICDCLRSRNKMDMGMVTTALKRYVIRKDKDVNILMQMAKEFGIAELAKSYMEVLL
jgi:predicted transcriptional regulator of viral defense system